MFCMRRRLLCAAQAIILAGYTHSMHIHDSIVSDGEKLMGYLLDKPQCQAYILHVHSLWKVRGSRALRIRSLSRVSFQVLASVVCKCLI